MQCTDSAVQVTADARAFCLLCISSSTLIVTLQYRYFAEVGPMEVDQVETELCQFECVDAGRCNAGQGMYGM